MCGWTDLPLTRLGHAQVDLLRRRLSRGASFAAIYSSPLRRARETANALRGLGPLHLRAELREICCGELDGMTLGQVRERFPELWEANVRQDDEDFRWPGGESYREFRHRCLSALGRVIAGHPAATVAIVTHAGFISQIVGAMKGESPARWDRHRAGNTSVTEIVWDRGSGVLVGFDDGAHLADRRALERRPVRATRRGLGSRRLPVG